MIDEKDVFVVEDDPVTSAILCGHLRSKHYNAVPFFSAESAAGAIAQKFPAILIIDYQLPGISGIELFEMIKPVIPVASVVIMASSVADGNMVLKFIQKGVRNFLIKDKMILDSLEDILADP